MVSYDIVLHPSARAEYENLQNQKQSELKTVLEDVASTEQPSQHEKVKHLEGHPGVLRLRLGDVRAIFTLVKPELRVLAVGHRKKMYRNVDEMVETRLTA